MFAANKILLTESHIVLEVYDKKRYDVNNTLKIDNSASTILLTQTVDHILA